MITTKTVIAAVFLLMVFFVSGCASSSSEGGGFFSGIFGKSETATGAFAGGTEALNLKFLDNQPPDEVFMSTNFNIAVLAENKGESDIKLGEATIILSKPYELIIGEDTLKTNKRYIKGVTKISGAIPGGTDTIVWKGAKFSGLPALTEAQKRTVSVDACYPYSTKIAVPLCVAETSEVCNPKESKKPESSGGPLQVTDFKQTAVPSEGKIIVSFTFGIENKGSDIYALGADCQNLDSELSGMVNITSITLGTKDYPVSSCRASAVYLTDGKGSQTCRIEVDRTSDFQDTLLLKLGFIY
ncbi:MAG: hypothetical protein V1839_04255 [archaeon]